MLIVANLSKKLMLITLRRMVLSDWRTMPWLERGTVIFGLHRQPSYLLCIFFACMTVGTYYIRSNTGS